MKRSLFFLILGSLLFISLPMAAWPMGDWSHSTPNGNTIRDYDQATLILKDGEELAPLEKWFFYKGYVCGLLKSGQYFTANELTNKVDTFGSEREWKHYLQENKIQPSIWTRWYDTDWVFLDSDLFLFFVYEYYVAIAVLFFMLSLLYLAIKREKLRPNQPFTFILCGLLLLLVGWWWLETFPQSI